MANLKCDKYQTESVVTYSMHGKVVTWKKMCCEWQLKIYDLQPSVHKPKHDALHLQDTVARPWIIGFLLLAISKKGCNIQVSYCAVYHLTLLLLCNFAPWTSCSHRDLREDHGWTILMLGKKWHCFSFFGNSALNNDPISKIKKLTYSWGLPLSSYAISGSLRVKWCWLADSLKILKQAWDQFQKLVTHSYVEIWLKFTIGPSL